MDALSKIVFLFCAMLTVMVAFSFVRVAKTFYILARPELDRRYMLTAFVLIIIYTIMVVNHPWR